MTARTYGAMALLGDHWIIGALEPQARIKLKALFPRIGKGQAPPYRFLNDAPHCAELAWFCDRYPLGMSAEDRRTLVKGKVRFGQIQHAAKKLKGADYQPPLFAGLKSGAVVRAHQAASAELLGMFKGLLVGDDVGEGKTFTGMAAALLPGALPAVVVCDKHLQQQWADRFEEFTTLSTHIVTGARPYPIPPVDVRIFSWTQILGWSDAWALMTVGLVIMDECQELRTGRATQRGQSADELCGLASMRLGLTATPIYNYGSEIWQVMRFIRPEVLGSLDEFYREWAPGGPVADPKALGGFLRERHAFVRKRKVGQRVNRLVQRVPADQEPLAAIEGLAQQLALRATTGAYFERGEATRELDLKVRQATGVAKARGVAAVLRALVESGEPVLVAAWHREVYQIWLKELADLKPAMFTGSETTKQKAAEKARFLSGDTDLMFISVRSGRGIDGLQARCRFVVIGELDWSPQVHDQFIGRVDREGSIVDDTPDEITALFLVTDDGSDPPMIERLGLKSSQSRGIVDPDLGIQTAKTDGSGLRLLVERYLARANGVRPAHGEGCSAHPDAAVAASAMVGSAEAVRP